MQTSKVAFVSVFAKIMRIVACVTGAFSGVCVFLSIPILFYDYNGIGAAQIRFLLFYSFTLAASCLLFTIGTRIYNRTLRLKKYISLMLDQNIASISSLATNSNKTADFVRNDLLTMISRNYLAGVKVDASTDNIVFSGIAFMVAPSQLDQESTGEMDIGITGMGKKPDSVSFCPYCGAQSMQGFNFCRKCGKSLGDH